MKRAYLTVQLEHENGKSEARAKSEHENNSERVVRNMQGR